jgi:hypothetical protein
MDSRQKIAVLIARLMFALIVIAGTLVLLARGALDSTDSRAKTQEQSRIVTKKPWRVEPVRVVAVKTKNKGNIEIGRAFDEDDDWLDGFTVTVVNNYDKTVTAMTVEMIFRREPGDTRPPVAKELHFGPSPSGLEYSRRDPNKVIKVGKTAELHLNSENYKNLKRDLEQQDYPNSIKRVELEIAEVGFEDGSVLRSGTLFLPDPRNPSDHTKKIAVPESPGAQNQRIRSPPARKNIITSFSFLKASLTLPNPTQPVECYAKEWQPRHYCDQVLTCNIRQDILEPFEMGAWILRIVSSTARYLETMDMLSVPGLSRTSKDMCHARYLAAINGRRVLCRATVVPGSTVMEASVNHQVALQRPVLINVLMGIVHRHL